MTERRDLSRFALASLYGERSGFQDQKVAYSAARPYRLKKALPARVKWM